MHCERIENLRQEYAGQYVIVDVPRPELARFADAVGQVKTIDFNGHALVQFEGADRSWHDVELDHLKVVDKPEPAEPKSPPKKEPKSPAKPVPAEKLSRLELARLEKEAGKKPSL